MLNWIVDNRLSLTNFMPEMVLGGGALLLIVLETFRTLSRKTAVFYALLVFSVFTALSFSELTQPSTALFSNMVAVDPFSVFFKILFGLTAIIVSYLVYASSDLKEYGLSEIFASLMIVTLGLTMMASSTDLLMMILSIEMVSVLSYILVGFRKHNRASSEAGLKYLLYGAVASGIMAFGMSFIYGLVGSTSFMDIRQYFMTLEGISAAPIVLFAMLSILVGIGYKMATFPSQMWCPDVYEGAPLPVTSFLSIAPKAAGFAMLGRFLITCFMGPDKLATMMSFIHLPTILSILAAVTMTLGNLGALTQNNLKRLLAYSSIAHAGYLLMGIAALSIVGLQAICFYFIAYLLMNLGAFYMVYFLSSQLGTEDIDGLKGLAWQSPVFAITFSVFLFSLIGLPPCMGFIGKFLIFSAIIQQKLYLLAGVAVLNTVVGLFYYARLMRCMFFEAPSSQKINFVGAPKWIVLSLAIPTIIFGLFWSPLVLNLSLNVDKPVANASAQLSK